MNEYELKLWACTIPDTEDENGPIARAVLLLFEQRDRLIAAAELVLWHRVGTQPAQGWLKDTGHSRDTLTNLAAVVAKVKGGAG